MQHMLPCFYCGLRVETSVISFKNSILLISVAQERQLMILPPLQMVAMKRLGYGLSLVMERMRVRKMTHLMKAYVLSGLKC